MKAGGNAENREHTDNELVHLVQSGDAGAFDVLTGRYMSALQGRAGRYANIVGIDTEDFVQEGMFALYRAAMGYKPEGGAQFGTYALTCINNSMSDTVRAYMKNLRQRTNLQMDDLDDAGIAGYPQAGLGTSVEDAYLDREDSNLRAQQIESLLSDFEQQVLKLYLRGHSYQQISIILSTATKAVDNALQRIRRKLRPEL